MSLTTVSKIYYGHEITSSNRYLDFAEGAGPELTATLNVGTYSLTDFGTEVKRALDAAGALTYTVSLNRSTRIFTVSTTSTFSLLASTGSHVGADAFSLLGFTSDQTSASSYAGSSASGSSYTPQFILQDHVAKENWQKKAYASISKTASGEIEVVSFGTESFVQFNIKYITNINQGSSTIITNNASGVSNAQSLMQYLITKGPVEFMPDGSDTATFDTLRLESTPDDSNGVGYKLKELYGMGLPGYFETGILKFRVV